MAIKINKNISGVEITNELHTDVGSGVFELDHDTIMDNSTLDVWTGANKTGTQLTQGTDYVLNTKITRLSDEAGVDVYRYIEVINSTYETGDLYFYYDTVGDFVEAEDINNASKASGTSFNDLNVNFTASELQTAIEKIIASNIPFDDTSFFETAPNVATALNALSSAGVVDEGSTADGDYIRYENGWQICIAELNFPFIASNILRKDWNFPQNFISKDKISITGSFDYDSSLTNKTIFNYNKDSSTSSNSAARLNGVLVSGATDSFASSDELLCFVIAIGRWK